MARQTGQQRNSTPCELIKGKRLLLLLLLLQIAEALDALLFQAKTWRQ